MSSPTGPQDNFDWGQVNPERDGPDLDQAARQVRVMLAAGRPRIDIQIWLEEFGLSPDDADAFLEKAAPLSLQKMSAAQLGGIVGAGLGALLSLAVTLALRPWDAEWVATRPGVIEKVSISSGVAVGYWLLGLAAFTIICGLLGTVFGQVLHHLQHGDRE